MKIKSKKRNRFIINVSSDEFEFFSNASKREKRPAAEIVRDIIRREIKERQQEPTAHSQFELGIETLRKEIAKRDLILKKIIDNTAVARGYVSSMVSAMDDADGDAAFAEIKKMREFQKAEFEMMLSSPVETSNMEVPR